jgi:hypothetical protein
MFDSGPSDVIGADLLDFISCSIDAGASSRVFRPIIKNVTPAAIITAVINLA